MQLYKSIKQRSLKQLSLKFTALSLKPNINIKSSSLRSFYKIIITETPAKLILKLRTIKDSIEDLLNTGNFRDYDQVKEKLGQSCDFLNKIQEYFNLCANILEHNNKLRVNYEILKHQIENEKYSELNQLKQIVKQANHVTCKSQFQHFILQNAQKIFNNNSLYSPSKQLSPTKSSRQMQLIANVMKNNKQIKQQVYLPINPDLLLNISKITENEYLHYHEYIFQKILVYLTTIKGLQKDIDENFHHNNINTNQKRITQILLKLRDLLKQLIMDELFQIQDNKFNQVLNYVLLFVKQNYTLLNKRKQQTEYYRKQLNQSIFRCYYMCYMTRNELILIINQLKQIQSKNIQINNQIQNQLNLKERTVELKDIQTIIDRDNIKRFENELIKITNKISQIKGYLCDKQESLFKQFYQRKLKKVLLPIDQIGNMISQVKKQNNFFIELIKKLKQDDEYFNKIFKRNNNMNKTQENHLFDYNNLMRKIQQFVDVDFERLKVEVESFLQDLNRIRRINQKQSNQIMKRLSQILQNVQSSQIKYNQLKLAKKNMKITSSQLLDEDLKKKLLSLQMKIIQQTKIKLQSNQNDVKSSKKSSYNDNNNERYSINSSVSSKYSVFKPHLIQQNQIILTKPILNETFLPSLKVDEFIQIANNFILDVLKNEQSLKMLEDTKNFDIQKLLNLICQAEKNTQIVNLINSKNNLNQIKKQAIKEPTKSSSKSPSKQINKKPPAKSPKKPPPKSKPVQKLSPNKTNTQKAQTPQPEIISSNNNKKQLLINLKNKLVFLNSLLLPQISQNLILKVFEQYIHTNLFVKICQILLNYKAKLNSQQNFIEAQKLGLWKLISERAKFINTITKNLSEIQKISEFLRSFSEEKYKLQVIEQITYDFVLKILLTHKQLIALKQQNKDLLKTGKLSVQGQQFLEKYIYQPFIKVFKNMLRIQININQIQLKKQLQHMLGHIGQCVELIKQIKYYVNSLKIGNLPAIQQIRQNLQNFVLKYNGFKKYQIFHYKKVQFFIKIIKSALNLKKSGNSQEIVNILQKQII